MGSSGYSGGGGYATVAQLKQAMGLNNVNNTADSAKSVKYANSAGSATTANSVAWGNVSGKPSTFAPATHTHSYLPLSGGTITGKLTVNDILATGNMDIKAASGSYKVYLKANDGVSVKNYSNSTYAPIQASAFSQSSSKRYKENIESMTDDDAKKILKLRPVIYDYINKAEGTNCMGLIAEEVTEIQEYQVIRDADGHPDALDYSKFVPQLIKMVQIQQKEIDKLKALIK